MQLHLGLEHLEYGRGTHATLYYVPDLKKTVPLMFSPQLRRFASALRHHSLWYLMLKKYDVDISFNSPECANVNEQNELFEKALFDRCYFIFWPTKKAVITYTIR